MRTWNKRFPRLVAALAFPCAVLFAGCGGTNDPGGAVCMPSTTAQSAASFCAPATIAAGQPLTLQIRESCGGCTQSATHCEVAVQGQTVTLRLLGQVCTLPPNTACPAICSISTFTCTVPALAAGTYSVRAEASTMAAIMMTADPKISATSCTVQ